MSAPEVPTFGRRSLLAGSLGLLALGALPALAGCGSASSAGAGIVDVPGLTALPADFQRDAVSLGSAPLLADVVTGMSAFGEHLHRVSANASENFTASPLSMAIAFGMLRAGCRARTASQVDAVFGFPSTSGPGGSPHAALNALSAALVTDRPVGTTAAPTPSGKVAPDPIVAVANAVFIDGSFTKSVAREFLRLLATQYGARASTVDFASPEATRAINAWVTKQTHGRIKKLFDSLDSDTRLVLANAVYLKAAWLNQFTRKSTVAADFTTATGTRVQAQLMRVQLEQAAYAETADWQRVTLPYVGGELSMRVVLPRRTIRDRPSLTQLLPLATAPRLDDAMRVVDLSLPRWDTATDLSLVDPLIALGMPDAFGDGVADLSGIAQGLHVSDAIHRANITVDERGTEAAAVTGIAIADMSIVGEPVPVRVDRPFVWAVVHEPTGAPVFVGHVVDAS